MKSKILFIFLFFFCSIGYGQKKSLRKYSTDTTLSRYISAHFYSEKEKDTCYSGIHFIKIQFSAKQNQAISISGELPDQYLGRIKQLIGEFSASYFNPKFINYCKKNKKMIVQPILFDISSNCVSHDSSLNFKNSEKILKDTIGRELSKLVIYNLIVQQFSIINSFKKISDNECTNCIILKSCIIQSKKIKNPHRA
jgi:hypothetical protein